MDLVSKSGSFITYIKKLLTEEAYKESVNFTYIKYVPASMFLSGLMEKSFYWLSKLIKLGSLGFPSKIGDTLIDWTSSSIIFGKEYFAFSITFT